MNENTTKLLEQLAAKMGTTTEYLWRVLLKQAPISATIALIQILLIILFGIALYRIHKNLLKKDAKGDDGYERYDMSAIVPMVFGGVLFVILSAVAFFCFDKVIYGYFNPEYWALKQVLKTISH